MADYYTNFSVIIPIPHARHIQYALQLAAQARQQHCEDQPVPNGFPTSLAEFVEEWSFETEATADGLWLHSQSGGIDAVCAFIQHLLEKFNPTGRVAFEWSHDCSKPRVDAFGGGAAFITATEIHTMNTSEWLRSLAA